MHLAAITLSINKLITTVARDTIPVKRETSPADRDPLGNEACNPPMNPNESTTSATSTRRRGGFDARDSTAREREREREKEREEGGVRQTLETICTHSHTESRALSPTWFASVARGAAISSHKVGADSSPSIPRDDPYGSLRNAPATAGSSRDIFICNLKYASTIIHPVADALSRLARSPAQPALQLGRFFVLDAMVSREPLGFEGDPNPNYSMRPVSEGVSIDRSSDKFPQLSPYR